MGIKMLHVKEFLEAKRTSGEKSEEYNKESEKWIDRAKDIAKLYRMAYGDDAEWCYEEPKININEKRVWLAWPYVELDGTNQMGLNLTIPTEVFCSDNYREKLALRFLEDHKAFVVDKSQRVAADLKRRLCRSETEA